MCSRDKHQVTSTVTRIYNKKSDPSTKLHFLALLHLSAKCEMQTLWVMFLGGGEIPVSESASASF